MLINKPLSADDVVTFKLVTGEEVIARLQEETDTAYVVTKPMALAMGAQGVGLVPAAFSAELNTVKFQKSHVILAALTRKEIIGNYIEGTTGIQTVKNAGILT